MAIPEQRCSPRPLQGASSFRGTISSQVDDPGSRLQRSGFCGMNTDVRNLRCSLQAQRHGNLCRLWGSWVLMYAMCLLWLAQVAEGVLDLDDYDTLAFRVRGDGRKYIASLRTENWMVDAKSQDVWQAFLFARCPKLHCSRCQPATTALFLSVAASCAGQQ